MAFPKAARTHFLFPKALSSKILVLGRDNTKEKPGIPSQETEPGPRYRKAEVLRDGKVSQPLSFSPKSAARCSAATN